MAREYSWNSSYAFAENDVIRSIDLEGAEKLINIYNIGTRKSAVIELKNAGSLGAGVLSAQQNENKLTFFYSGTEKAGFANLNDLDAGVKSVLAGGSSTFSKEAKQHAFNNAVTSGRERFAEYTAPVFISVASSGIINPGTSAILQQGVDIGLEAAQQFIINKGDINKIDFIDITAAGLPDVVGLPAQAAFDYTLEGGNQNIFNGKKPLVNAAIELSISSGLAKANSKLFEGLPSNTFNNFVKKQTKVSSDLLGKGVNEGVKKVSNDRE